MNKQELIKQKLCELVDILFNEQPRENEKISVSDFLYETIGIAKKRKGFDLSFLESLHKQLSKSGKLTTNQIVSLKKINSTLQGKNENNRSKTKH